MPCSVAAQHPPASHARRCLSHTAVQAADVNATCLVLLPRNSIRVLQDEAASMTTCFYTLQKEKDAACTDNAYATIHLDAQNQLVQVVQVL